MELLQCLKNNSSTFHIRTKEDIDQLFNELSVKKLPIDNKLDFDIRMAIQKVKLQMYYELKLVEYRFPPLLIVQLQCITLSILSLLSRHLAHMISLLL